MVSIIDKKCITCNLNIPSFNYPNEQHAFYCNDCKKYGMVDIENKKCVKCNLKIPIFNYPNEKQPFYCNDCKTDKTCIT